jgi:succinyl-CoA synthetase beta subunit
MAGPLDELRAAKLLELYGVRRPAERAVDTPEEAARAARAVGFPVAVKALAPEMPHKERLGGIRLGLADAAGVTTAASEVMAAAQRAGARHPQVLVQRMVRGTEVLVGAVVDERFGPAVTIRPGGALAEAGEATFIAAPLTRKQAGLFVERHAQACGLDPRADDLAAAARAVEGIARAAADLRGRLVTLEANPLIVRSRGAVAVDALAEARPPA